MMNGEIQMNMREKFKKLFTLAKRSHDGFTLVELIVVMAILAVLGGIGIPAYSAYVEEANITADETLVAEVEHALQLAHYSQELNTDGCVVLSDSTPTYGNNMEIESALKASFGSDLSKLTLKYDRWTSGTSVDVLNCLMEQGADAAAAVANSTYAGNISQMLDDTQNCTSALAKFLGSFNDNNIERSFATLAGNSEGLGEILAEAGLAELNNGNYKLVDANNTSTTQLSNALVLAIASEVNNKAELKDDLMEAWRNALVDDWSKVPSLTMLADMAAEYAFYESVVGYLNDDTLNTAFAQLSSEFNSATSQDAVLSSMSNMGTKIHNYAMDSNHEDRIDKYVDTQLPIDVQAFISVMGAVDSASSNLADGETLNKEGLYLNDEISNAVNGYIAAAKAFELLPDTLNSGEVMILFLAEEGKTFTVPSIQ